MLDESYTKCDATGVSEETFASVSWAAEEVRTSAAYRWNNHRRGDHGHIVIQRTLAGTAFFEDAGGRQLVPEGFAMVYSHSEASRYGYAGENREPYRHRWVVMSAGGLRGLFERLRDDFGGVVRMPEASEATAIFEELSERFHGRTFRDRFHESELLYRLLVAIYREQVRRTEANDPIEFGYHYLRNHFRSPVNLKGVAEKCGVSREHFIREFHARYSEPPGAMLRRLRLESARAMLAATELGLEEIARSCGFACASTFCRAFRTRFAESAGTARSRRNLSATAAR